MGAHQRSTSRGPKDPGSEGHLSSLWPGRLAASPGEQVSKRHPSNEINKTSAEVQVRTPPRLYETNHDIVRYD